MINQAKAISNDDKTYTESSFEILQDAIMVAESTHETVDPEDVDTLTNAITALQDAIDGLERNATEPEPDPEPEEPKEPENPKLIQAIQVD